MIFVSLKSGYHFLKKMGKFKFSLFFPVYVTKFVVSSVKRRLEYTIYDLIIFRKTPLSQTIRVAYVCDADFVPKTHFIDIT